ncbi:MAG: YkgJ family cysteine cluster protein [Parachlamydiaceae bacterium]
MTHRLNQETADSANLSSSTAVSKLKVLSNDEAQTAADKPWYAEGLRFKCTECGQCCTGAPGYVWVTKEEIVALATHLNLSLKEFSKKYLRHVYGRYSLLEKKDSHDCIFLKDKKCQVYMARPTQCRTFPWWPGHLSSPESWQEAASSCEGIRPDAPIVPFDTIEKARQQHE